MCAHQCAADTHPGHRPGLVGLDGAVGGLDWPSASSMLDSATPATQPGPGRGKKKDHGFKVSADGRLIIREEDDAATTKTEEEEGTKGGTTIHSRGTAASGVGSVTLTRSFIHSFVYLLIHSGTTGWGSVDKYR